MLCFYVAETQMERITGDPLLGVENSRNGEPALLRALVLPALTFDLAFNFLLAEMSGRGFFFFFFSPFLTSNSANVLNSLRATLKQSK